MKQIDRMHSLRLNISISISIQVYLGALTCKCNRFNTYHNRWIYEMLVFVERSTKFPSANEFRKRPTRKPSTSEMAARDEILGAFGERELLGNCVCIWVNFEKYTTVTADSQWFDKISIRIKIGRHRPTCAQCTPRCTLCRIRGTVK